MDLIEESKDENFAVVYLADWIHWVFPILFKTFVMLIEELEKKLIKCKQKAFILICLKFLNHMLKCEIFQSEKLLVLSQS